ncbi:MAG TPA: hypothetical protein VMM27_04365 [Casimicrobiaceae bacterium]|nr:hypothetical protein [Casimicrobiaceae bacterium]
MRSRSCGGGDGITAAAPAAGTSLPEVNRTIYGIYGPKGLAADAVGKLHDSVKRSLRDPKVRDRIEETGP